MPHLVLRSLALTGLLACTSPADAPPGSSAPDPEISRQVAAPEGAPPGSCWGRADTPNAVRLITREIEVVPPEYGPDGTITRPGIYRREEVREIAPTGTGTLFEIPCPGTLVPEFTASLQRALAARALYFGPITGRFDRATRNAIRRYQSAFGLDSAQVSRRMAEDLGLAVSSR